MRGLEGVSANTPGSLARPVITKHNCVMGLVYGMRSKSFIGTGEWRGYLYYVSKQWDKNICVTECDM